MASAVKVIIDPFVALSILDVHARRSDGATLVVGTLFGSYSQGVVEVRNFTPNFENEHAQLTQRAAPRDLSVGWFSTGTFDLEKTAKLHSYFENVALPVFVCVELPTNERQGLTFRAMVQTSTTLSTGVVGPFFKEVSCVVQSLDVTSQVAVDTLVESRFPAASAQANPYNASLTAPGMHAELVAARKTLADVQQYIADVLAKKRPGDNAVARSILTALSTVNDGQEEETTVNTMNDALMMTYVAKVLRQQLAHGQDLQRRASAKELSAAAQEK